MKTFIKESAPGAISKQASLIENLYTIKQYINVYRTICATKTIILFIGTIVFKIIASIITNIIGIDIVNMFFQNLTIFIPIFF